MIGDFQYCIKVVDNYTNELRHSEWFENTINAVGKFADKVHTIRCLALGRVSENIPPRFQLALLLLIIEKYGSTVTAWDPVFSDLDKLILEHYKIAIIETPPSQAPDMWYVPHGPASLIQSLPIGDTLYLGNNMNMFDDAFVEYKQNATIISIDAAKRERWFLAFHGLALHKKSICQ